MVRYVNSPSEGVCSENNRFKSSICQPKDNIGIACIFPGGNAAAENKPSTGVRRRYVAPKDNLGIACLPTAEFGRLRDIPEVSEYDSTDEIHVNTNNGTLPQEKQNLHFTSTKLAGRAGHVVPEDNLQRSSQCANRGVTIPRVRLRAGEDGDQIQNRSPICNGSKIERLTHLRRKENINFHNNNHAVEQLGRIIPLNKKIQVRTTSLDIGISNIRRPKHDPTRPRKPIVPRDNIAFSGCHLQKSSIRTSGPKASAAYSIKNISRDSEKKSSKKSLSTLSDKQNLRQNKSLRTIKPPQAKI